MHESTTTTTRTTSSNIHRILFSIRNTTMYPNNMLTLKTEKQQPLLQEPKQISSNNPPLYTKRNTTMTTRCSCVSSSFSFSSVLLLFLFFVSSQLLTIEMSCHYCFAFSMPILSTTTTTTTTSSTMMKNSRTKLQQPRHNKFLPHSLNTKSQQQQQQQQLSSTTAISGSLHQAMVVPTLNHAVTILRGGGGGSGGVGTTAAVNVASTTIRSMTTFVQQFLQLGTSTPQLLFNTIFTTLLTFTVFIKISQKITANESSSERTKRLMKPPFVKSLQIKFLLVFWLLRCSDWLQGPYFYEVYASKQFGLASISSVQLISYLFLTGFASTALFGPTVGQLTDQYGRKLGTIVFTILYTLGALSTKSSILPVLFMGRILSGIGTSLLFSAPESWLVGEAQRKQRTSTTTSTNNKDDEVAMVDGMDYLGETFGLAYAGDSLVAITAGQMASIAANKKGPTGPFELSTLFLAIGGICAAFLWKENKGSSSSSSRPTTTTAEDDNKTKSTQKTSTQEALEICWKDPKIMLVGAVQSLFEAAMYIFVLQWPPAMASIISKAYSVTSKTTTAAAAAAASTTITTPYGTIFSCFMACCLLGSTLFGQLMKLQIPTETFTTLFLGVATIAMTTAATTMQRFGSIGSIPSFVPFLLPLLTVSFFLFEMAVGMYFPSIGTLRSKYVPDSHRSLIMNLFGIPLNVLVVSVFLSINRLGVSGALSISAGALGIATLCMVQLQKMVKKETNQK